jgi:hypothetical protein
VRLATATAIRSRRKLAGEYSLFFLSRAVQVAELTWSPPFLDTIASDRFEEQINVNFGFSKNEVSFLYTMIVESVPDYCLVFRAIPPLSDRKSGLEGFRLDGRYVSAKSKQSSFHCSSASDFLSDPEPSKAETLPTPTGVEVHMCIPGGEEGVLAFIRALEDCLREYGVKFGEGRGGGGGVLYYKLF